MEVSVREFQREYVNAIREGYAAIFAGAGLSVSSGYVDWKELLRELASDIKLDVDKESDLVAVAQYYCNERHGRDTINQQILNRFTKDSQSNRNIEILSQLPISTFWTTNYDSLLEDELRNRSKRVDLKVSQESLSTTLPKRDCVVYKMHGDVSDPSNAVITKDDYESYNISRQLFTTALQGDLVSKTFLFIGFSFQDPNLNYILSRIRVLLSKNRRTHYCFFRRVNRLDYDSEESYSYAKVKNEHQIRDLRRYGICAVMVDEYFEITEILSRVLSSHLLQRVFISGSASIYGKDWDERARKFLSDLSQRLIKEEFSIVTGFGFGVGSFILNGALSEIMSSKQMDIDKYLYLRPFPHQESPENKALSYDKYRTAMISEAGVCIFLFGNKEVDNEIVKSTGTMEEFEIAQKLGKYLIPIGSTGFTASDIFSILKEDSKNFSYLDGYWDTLENNQNEEVLISIVIEILKNIKKHDENRYTDE